MVMYFSSTKTETFGKLMVHNIFLSSWRDSCSDWGNGLPKNRGRIKKGAWISQPSKNLQEFLDSKRIRDIKSQTQSHSKKMKSKQRESFHSLSRLNVINLPGKKKLRTEAVKSASKVSGKCNICGITFVTSSPWKESSWRVFVKYW